MKIIELGIEEMARTGFTHKAIIQAAVQIGQTTGDFTAAATTQTYNLGPVVPLGAIVDNCAVKVVTALSGGAVSAATIQVGYTGTTNGFIAATTVFTGATTPIVAAGADLASTPGKGFTAATQLVAVLTTTTANVNALTAGELHIYWRQKDPTKF